MRAQRHNGVLERLALLDARPARREVHDVGAQPLGRQLEARARSSGGLVEEVQHGPAAQRGDLLDLAVGDLGERGGPVADVLDRLAVEVLDAQEMPHQTVTSLISVIVTSSTSSSSSTATFTRSLREVGRFLPT